MSLKRFSTSLACIALGLSIVGSWPMRVRVPLIASQPRWQTETTLKYVFQSESAIASFDAFVPTSMARILIADDSELTRSRRTAALSTHADWTIWGEAANGRKAVLLT